MTAVSLTEFLFSFNTVCSYSLLELLRTSAFIANMEDDDDDSPLIFARENNECFLSYISRNFDRLCLQKIPDAYVEHLIQQTLESTFNPTSLNSDSSIIKWIRDKSFTYEDSFFPPQSQLHLLIGLLSHHTRGIDCLDQFDQDAIATIVENEIKKELSENEFLGKRGPVFYACCNKALELVTWLDGLGFSLLHNEINMLSDDLVSDSLERNSLIPPSKNKQDFNQIIKRSSNITADVSQLDTPYKIALAVKWKKWDVVTALIDSVDNTNYHCLVDGILKLGHLFYTRKFLDFVLEHPEVQKPVLLVSCLICRPDLLDKLNETCHLMTRWDTSMSLELTILHTFKEMSYENIPYNGLDSLAKHGFKPTVSGIRFLKSQSRYVDVSLLVNWWLNNLYVARS